MAHSTNTHTKLWFIPVLLLMTGCQSISFFVKDEVSPPQSSSETNADFQYRQFLAEQLKSESTVIAVPTISSKEVEATSLPLSAGDRLKVEVAEGEHFSGQFEVNIDGKLHIPYLTPIQAAGRTVPEVERTLKRVLVEDKIFRAEFVQVSVRIQQWSGVHVSVAGAVFSPGQVIVNTREVEVRTHQLTQRTGDAPLNRFLSDALSRAGGVRPDADISQITLIRDGAKKVFNMSGLLTGAQVHDPALVAGDRVMVSSLGYIQDELMRPSSITPPGFDIFISNLSTPADSNSKSAVNKTARSTPYGTRLLRGLMAANCVGGTQATNASRMAVLVTTDRMSGKSHVYHRSVEQLVRHHDRDDYNPYLMPNDGIACYDSGVTNARDVARSFSDIFSPLMMLRTLLGGA